VHKANYGVYGIRKVHAQPAREGITGCSGRPVARCTTQRLMKEPGLRGISRAKGPRTTVPGAGLDTRPTWSTARSPHQSKIGCGLPTSLNGFDEPTIGLHPHDSARMNALLLQLRDKSNTVLVVEHKPEAIAIGDHVVDLGPGAGTAGGGVVFQGTVDELRRSGRSLAGTLDDRASLKTSVRAPSGAIEVHGASTHNLRDIDVDIPLGVLVVVTGVAGSGKSSLITGSVAGRDGVVSIDQGAIKGSRRSNPATDTGLLDPVRKAFAKANGVKPALFSANSEGACLTCKGAGVVYT